MLINLLPTTAIVIASGDVFAAASSSATRRKPLGNPACFCAFCPPDRQQLASRFWQPAFVISRSGSDEAVRNGDAKPMDLFTAVGEAHLQFKPIVVGGIRFRPIERDQGWKFSRQALLDIGCFECRATQGHSAMFGRNGEADRGQRGRPCNQRACWYRYRSAPRARPSL